MGFFDTLGKKATEAYNVTTKKTGELAKEAKLRMKINENKSNINDLYKEIGKKVYEKHVRQENIDIKADLEEECAKIDILSSEIESCLTSILELKDKKQCIKCHAEIDENAVFCPKCGEKQPEIEVKEAEVVTENLENSDVKPENATEAEIVDEKAYYHTGRSGHDRLRHLQALYASRSENRRTLRHGRNRRYDDDRQYRLGRDVFRSLPADAYPAGTGEQHRPAVGAVAGKGGRGDA